MSQAPQPSARRWHQRHAFGLLTLVCLASAVTHLLQGSLSMGPMQVLAAFAEGVWPGLGGEQLTDTQYAVFWEIRLPRMLFAILVGSALALSGATLQGLFRNPLADPGLIGVSSGGAAGAVLAMVLLAQLGLSLHILGVWLTPLLAMLGGLAATALAYRIARLGKRTHVTTLLLAGVAINAFSGALVGIALYMASDDQLRRLAFWMLGSLGRANWQMLLILVPLVVVPMLLLQRYKRELNAFMLGESEAWHLGVPIQRLKWLLILLNAVMVGAVVAFSGLIGFIGLVTPHMIRLWLGPDHRNLLPASMLLGAILLLGADSLARSLNPPSEIPIGILTALIGGPFFIWLLLRRKRTLTD